MYFFGLEEKLGQMKLYLCLKYHHQVLKTQYNHCLKIRLI